MRTGLLAAGSGPVLVTMADASDDLEALPRMLEAYRGGARLVVGSRFMPGGRQLEGHPVKSRLARWGSLALHWSGFPVRDASNAFRLYDAEMVRSLTPGEVVGFEVTLALLLAAWRAGVAIAEVPVTWRGRREGTSRFQARWIPRYGRFWLEALLLGLRGGPAAPRRNAGHGP